MTSSGTVKLRKIFDMLDKCLPGHTKVEKTHHWWITSDDKIYTSFPSGEHGKKNPEIEKGHIRHMVRFFEIEDCAKGELEILR